MFKNTACTVIIQVWNTSTGLGQTGDSANLTVRGVGDGALFTPSSPTITEIDSTNLKGIYSVALTAGENNYSFVGLGGKSSTANVVLMPISWSNESDANTVKIAGTAQTAVNLGSLKIKKNAALAKFAFLMVASTDHVTPKTGATVACQRSIDGAAFANCNTAVATEVGSGVYYVDLAASDLNGDVIVLKFTATGADQRTIVIATEP